MDYRDSFSEQTAKEVSHHLRTLAEREAMLRYLKERRRAGNLPGRGGKKLFRSLLLKKVFTLLAPFLPFAVVFLLILLLLVLLVAAIYATMCPFTFLTGVEASPLDPKIKAKYEELVSTEWKGKPAWNVADTYLVPDEPAPGTAYYPRTDFENPHKLLDRDRKDEELKLRWGTVHAVCLYWQYVKGEKEIPDWLREKVARDLHPYFYYIKRTETYSVSCPKGSHSETYPVYLLVEARTIYGYFQYHYKEVTETYQSGECTVTHRYWRLEETRSLWPDRFWWIKEYLKDLYGFRGCKKEEESAEAVRKWVMEAGEGFTRQMEWLEWLLGHYALGDVVSAVTVPPEYRPYLEEAERVFGVPWWFLAALFQTESSWNPLAINPDTGCFGITQQHPAYWKGRWEELKRMGLINFNTPEELQWDPRAQILAGALDLRNKLRQAGADPRDVDWKGDGWKDDPRVWKAIAAYKGWANWDRVGVNSVPPGPRAKEELKQLRDVISGAEGFKSSPGRWPVPGYHRVISRYGVRRHPILGDYRPHYGIDIACPEGTPVVAVSNGVVTYVGWVPGYGYCVQYRDATYEYLYAHLKAGSSRVKVGDHVNAGEVLALSGNTGLSEGPHLHFGVYRGEVGDYKTNAVDPLKVLGGAQ
ncbi:M23 family metallopeptidase [Ammonifex thiophilus]|uniref:Peptidase M23 n=1 Tax=Ammonifex thiophilus TaxID=444093 RepID=A0A3D8P394_9THEO|nr:M23 family metallopeptidase [Ammonifex thiophilus]RDV81232.1 peptidase M23 [Ammonifex thiophilus]